MSVIRREGSREAVDGCQRETERNCSYVICSFD